MVQKACPTGAGPVGGGEEIDHECILQVCPVLPIQALGASKRQAASVSSLQDLQNRPVTSGPPKHVAPNAQHVLPGRNLSFLQGVPAACLARPQLDGLQQPRVSGDRVSDVDVAWILPVGHRGVWTG